MSYVTLDTAGGSISFPHKEGIYDILNLTPGCYKIAIISNALKDGNRANDTAYSNFIIASKDNGCDVAVLKITTPNAGDSIQFKTGFNPVAIIRGEGDFINRFDVPIRAQILRCSDNQLVWKEDTIIAEIDTSSFIFTFAGGHGETDLAQLAPGCYSLCIFSRDQCDTIHSNDTACTNFFIAPKSAVSTGGSIKNFEVSQNFPNPFSSSTTISYSLPERGRIILRIADVTGRIIRQIESEKDAGDYEEQVDLANFPDGIYSCQLSFINESGERISFAKNMILMK